MALTQMALDSLDFDATVALATKVAPHVDILEIGTPCIKHNGIKLLETLRAKFPNNKILVDLKTMDAGFYESEPFYKAGADIITVLGTADIGTIKGVIDAANKYGKQAQVDLINVTDKKARTLEVAKLGAHIIGVHTGLDQQAAGQTPFTDLALVNSLNTGAKVSVAGGIKAATVKQVIDAGANIVVAGAAIYGAADPAAAAKEITGLARAGDVKESAGGFNWLPWVLAIGAGILGLFLLKGCNKPAEPVVDGAAVEQTMPAEGAATEAAPAVEGSAPAATEAAPVEGAAPAATEATPTEGAAPAATEPAAEAAPAADANVVEQVKDAAATAAEVKTDGLVGAAKEAAGDAAK
ncbi:MAG TPA: 3-hexulose-6-phosphate synthase [Methylotenera sp.]|nr:3-hexulose-6-phosphate synthase [Methylotenera sp.]HPH06570.1 3-hexulose-6-phosphate synthase [Methylotenera sp.]HPN01899.1 3-hexulose-6-phosphate synthase [Methylotenera sp.]